MANISVSLPSDGTTADVADYNTPINTIVNEFNGNIDNSNISGSAAISGSKIATDSITDTQLDLPRWWQEIGRTTLGSAGDTITVSSLPVRKYLRIVVTLLATGGAVDGFLRFNNDSGNNYSRILADNGAADVLTGNQSSIVLAAPGTHTTPQFANAQIYNVATQEKLVVANILGVGVAGAAAAPTRRESFGKWSNTTDAITRIDVINTAAGDFASGSEVIVLGHD